MISMENLNLEDVLGLWDSEDFKLIITPESATLTKKIEERISKTESIIWHHILEKENIKHYNTIHLSKSIYIHLLSENNLT